LDIKLFGLGRIEGHAKSHEGISEPLDPNADGTMTEIGSACFGNGVVVNVDDTVEVVCDGFGDGVKFVEVIFAVRDKCGEGEGCKVAHSSLVGGRVLDVKPGDELLLTLTLRGTTWVQSINDLTTRQAVSYELDMMGQEQNLGLFAIETYNDGHIDGEVVFRNTLITFSEPNADNCSSRYRASNGTLSPPVMSGDGLTCFIEYVTLGGKSSYLSQDRTYETQDDKRSPKTRTAMAKAYRTPMATTRALLRDTATMIRGLPTKS